MPECTEIHYVIRRSQWMQKHMFGIKCFDAAFVQSILVTPKHEK
jgi:hypothetical protein